LIQLIKYDLTDIRFATLHHISHTQDYYPEHIHTNNDSGDVCRDILQVSSHSWHTNDSKQQLSVLILLLYSVFVWLAFFSRYSKLVQQKGTFVDNWNNASNSRVQNDLLYSANTSLFNFLFIFSASCMCLYCTWSQERCFVFVFQNSSFTYAL